jgi:hypothetical protein
LPAATIASTMVRPTLPVPPATATVTILEINKDLESRIICVLLSKVYLGLTFHQCPSPASLYISIWVCSYIHF